MSNFKRLNNQKGAALIVVSLIVLTILMIIFLGISSSLTREIKMFKSLEDSPFGYYAADSGAERLLYKLIKEVYTPLPPYPVDVSVAANGDTVFELDGGGYYKLIALSSRTFRSIGIFENISRVIEISY